ncbi:MAG: hypothetical protein ACM3NW_06035, partial [Syntrophomonadaceae bacterium]
MSSTFPSLPADVQALVDQKKFDAIESLWTRRVEEGGTDLRFFFALAAAVKKKGGATQAVAWLRLLAEFHGSADGEAKTQVLLEIARMAPADAEVRRELTGTLKARFAGHPALSAVLAQFPLEKAQDPSEVAGRIARWLSFRPGQIFFMPGRGAGRLVELNPALDVMRIEVGGAKVPLSLVSAEKNLVPLPEGHFLRRKVEDLPGLAALAEKEPAEALHLLLESFGKPLTVTEVREHFAGVVPEDRWSTFWTAARKNRQVLVSGSSKSATVTWSASADAAEESVRRAFAEAEPASRIELARKHAKRSKELARFFAAALAEDARAAAAGKPALAWELSQSAQRLAPGEPEAFPAAALLAVPEVGRVVAEVRDSAAREKALLAVREARPDWPALFTDQIAREEDGRVLTTLFDALGERAADLSRKVLRSPRSAPRAFVWLAERMHAEGRVEGTALFFALTDALRMDEFSGLRSRLKEFFEPGGLAVALVRAATSEEEARQMLHA